MVSNIPLGLNNYDKELKDLFEHKALPSKKKVNVSKVDLVYDPEEVEELELEIKKEIQKKQKYLEETPAPDKNKVHAFDEEIEKIETKLEHTRKHI